MKLNRGDRSVRSLREVKEKQELEVVKNEDD
jgi:hypothetical protein